MHPVKRKNTTISAFIIVITVIVVVISFIYGGSHYFAIIISQFLMAQIYRGKVKKAIVLLSIYSLISFSIVLILDLAVLRGILRDSEGVFSNFVSIFFLSLIVVPYRFIGNQYEKIQNIAEKQLHHYSLVNNFPNLICIEHLTRTSETKMLTYKSIDCRISEECNYWENRIISANKLIGLIGKQGDSSINDGNFYAIVWNPETKEIMNGDYDIIEIHENHQIDDYNAVINKVINYFYNQIGRYKPINQVDIRIIGNPLIKDNTKRLLEKYFRKVEYLTLGQKKKSIKHGTI